jgi:phosphoribosylformylglycinamidine (FGAM) synthase-like amidotransferase family enzyme
MLDPGLNIDRLTGRSAAADKAWVALYDAGGTGGDGASSVQRILSRSGMQVVRVGAEEIAAGSLAEFDLVVFPGGSGSKEAAAIGEAGREQVRQFVERGGGYIGICAGAYGQGRVLFVSPHPEQTAGLEDLVRRAAEWTAGKP